MNRFGKLLTLVVLGVVALIAYGCEENGVNEPDQYLGDTLTGLWEGSYSVLVNPGGTTYRDSLQIRTYGYEGYTAAAIVLNLGSEHEEPLFDTLEFQDTLLVIDGSGIILNDTQQYSFEGKIEWPVFSGTFRIASKTSYHTGEGNFVVYAQ